MLFGENSDWASHTMTAILGFGTGSLLPFFLKLREQRSTDKQAAAKLAVEAEKVDNESWANERRLLLDRITSLENKYDTMFQNHTNTVLSMHAEHAKCLETQGELKGRIASLMEIIAPKLIVPAGLTPPPAPAA